jgi:tetraacyldisaccharide 4'-kinase
MEHLVRSILEGRHPGPASTVLRTVLAPLGLAYGCLAAGRTAAYRYGLLASHRVEVPVISVGNLTVGGTGKTPFVVLLVRYLCDAGRRPAILLRGYGSAEPQAADEAKLLEQLLPDAAVHPHPDRVRAAQEAIEQGADVLVLDDGFQHHRLQRNLDVVLLDGTAPWGGGLPLPAGLLREFRSAIRRADVVCLTRTSPQEIEPSLVSQELAILHRLAPNTPVACVAVRPVRLCDLNGRSHPLETLAGRRVAALAGIARPDAFCKTLRELGAEIARSFALPDHHAYPPAATDRFLAWSKAEGVHLVTTEKDAVKLTEQVAGRDRERVWVLGIELEIWKGGKALFSRVREAIP